MTPIAQARRLAHRNAKHLGHQLHRMQPSPYNRWNWITSCVRCGRTLGIEPNLIGPRGEWLFSGNAIRMKCATAVSTYRKKGSRPA